MRDYKAKDVDEYIANSSAESQQTLKDIRKLIISTIPNAEEGISWGVPFYKYHGLLGGFAALKNHASFGLAFVLDNKVRKKLEQQGYTTGKKTVQIKFDQKVPTLVIKQILRTKAKINESKNAIN